MSGQKAKGNPLTRIQTCMPSVPSMHYPFATWPRYSPLEMEADQDRAITIIKPSLPACSQTRFIWEGDRKQGQRWGWGVRGGGEGK